jgi:arylformamidase
MIVFPGDPPPSAEPLESDGFRTTRLSLTSHTGTHIDAPSHAVAGGAALGSVPLSRLIAPCRVVMVTGPVVTKDAIRSSGWVPGEGLLVRTGFSEATSFDPSYTVLAAAAASLLAERGAALFGTDTPSPEPPDGDGSVHRILLSAGIPILELLALSGIPPGRYLAIALPLNLPGADGAPSRVILSDLPLSGENYL